MRQSSYIEKTRPIQPSPRRLGLHVAAVYLEPPVREELPHIDKDAAAIVVDELLLRVAHHESACRLNVARLTARLLDSRVYHRLGFARLGDYTLERLGLSAREIQSAARVSRAVDALPRLGEALRSGELNWTKLRAICDVADDGNVERWIAAAQRMTSRELDVLVKESRRVRREADRVGETGLSVAGSDVSESDMARSNVIGSNVTGSNVTGSNVTGSNVTESNMTQSPIDNRSAEEGDDAGGVDQVHPDLDQHVDQDVTDTDLIDGEPRAELHIRCPAHLRPLWNDVAELASRSAGSVLAGWQALELVAAEAASGCDLRQYDLGDQGDGSETRRAFGAFVHRPGDDAEFERSPRLAGWDGELEVLRALVGAGLSPDQLGPTNVDPVTFDPVTLDPATLDPALLGSAALDATTQDFSQFAIDEFDPDLVRADHLNADQLDDALRAVLDSMRNIDWQLGRLLATFSRLNLHRHIGYSSLAVYVRERLGLSSRKASSLLRIEGNPAEGRGELAAAYRTGRISWIRTIALLPVVSRDHCRAWIERAEQVTVRRLFDEVRWALDMRDRSWLFMELVPPSLGMKLEHSDAAADRQMRALYDADTVERIKLRPRLDTTYLRFSGPASVIEFFHDVLQSYSDRSSPWEAAWKALERLLLHVKAEWSAVPGHRNPIHERDGWRCRVPGCSSRRNLQEHHVLYRSRGGGNERGNRISICAWHHLRGIHAGLVRAHGDADTGIHWQLANRLRLVDDVYA